MLNILLTLIIKQFDGNNLLSNDIKKYECKIGYKSKVKIPNKALNNILFKPNTVKRPIPFNLHERLMRILDRTDGKNNPDSYYPYIQTIRITNIIYMVLQDKSSI
jgi:hypothetical protein